MSVYYERRSSLLSINTGAKPSDFILLKNWFFFFNKKINLCETKLKVILRVKTSKIC